MVCFHFMIYLEIKKANGIYTEGVIMSSSTIALPWHKPDNTANIFFAVSCEADPHVYRITMELTSWINKGLLQEALEQTLPYFRAFDVQFKRRIFTSVFEAQYLYPQVEEDTGYPCRFFPDKNGNDFWFRLLYHQNKIHLEASHALSDGTGAVYFLKAVGYRYIQLACTSCLPAELREARYGLEHGMNVIDGYAGNYKKVKKTEHREKPAFTLEGERRTIGDIGVMSIDIPVCQLKAVSKAYQATISEYMAAIILSAVRDSYKENRDKPISMELPVNLRPIFNTETSLNFFSNVSIVLKPEELSYSFEEILTSVKIQFKEKIKKELFEQRFGFTVWGERCLIARMTPVIARNWFLRKIYALCAGNNTIGFSNMGIIAIEPGFEPFIKKISAFTSPTPKVPVKIVSCSTNEIFNMTIATKLCDNTLPEKIVEKLKESDMTLMVEKDL